MNDIGVLILGSRIDPHVTRVEDELKARGVIVEVLDFLSDQTYALTATQEGGVTIQLGERTLPEQLVIWDSERVLPGTLLYPKGTDGSEGYIAQEWRAFYTLIKGLRARFVSNSLESRVCRMKPHQQQIASQCGFLVPPSLVTNHKHDILQFGRDHGDLIIKSLSGKSYVPASEEGHCPYSIMTMDIDLDAVSQEDESAFLACPHFLQKKISKDHELRIVVAGGQMVAFKVNSQSAEMTSTDWRKNITPEMFTEVEISLSLRQKLLRFMEAFGYDCGSFDLIVSPDDQVWFLECNQLGAWVWLDDLCEGRVTKIYADFLEREARKWSGRVSVKPEHAEQALAIDA